MSQVARLLEQIRMVAGDNERRTVITASLSGFSIRVAGMLLMTLVTIMLTRLMGATEFGRLAFLLSGSFIIVLFAGLGLSTASSRLLPRYLGRGNRAMAAHYVLASLIALAATAVFSGIAFAVLIDSLPGIFEDYRFSTAGIVGLVVTISFMRFLSEGSRACGLPHAGFLAESVVVRLFLLGFLLLCLLLDVQLSASLALHLWVLAQSVVVLGLLVLMLAKVTGGEGRWTLRSLRQYRSWLGVSLVMLITPVYYYLLFETDVVLLGIIAGPEEVGLYQVARRLAELVVFCSGAVSAVGLPRLASAYAARDQHKIQATVDVMNLINLGTIAAATFGVVVLGQFALGIFGPEFKSAFPALLVLTIGRLLAAMFGPASDLLLMTGHHRRLGRINLVFALINICLNIALIPTLGILGAAISTSLASVCWSAWLYRMSRRLTTIETCGLRRLSATFGHDVVRSEARP